MKKFKVTMHFNKHGAKTNFPWTVHFRNKCHLVSEIQCLVPMVSVYKPDKKDNPRAFFTAQSSNVEFIENNEFLIAKIKE